MFIRANSLFFMDILGDKSTVAYSAAKEIVIELGHTVTDGSHFIVHIAIAPLLTEKLSESKLNEPILGTLIFHPSPLPYGRGASSIKWAFIRHEPITAATWFWANSEYDAGDICEQEIIKIDYEMRPREFYEKHIIPGMMRTLKRCLNDLQKGIIRRVTQEQRYATYDTRL